MENGKKMLRRDWSGKPREVNADLLTMLIEHDYVPVLTIPICDEQGFAINSENDDIVARLQTALGAKTVIQLIEAPGFMDDIDNAESLVRKMSFDELAQREAQVEGRMKRKMHALTKLAKGDAQRIIICDGRGEHPIRAALAGGGTWITAGD